MRSKKEKWLPGVVLVGLGRVAQQHVRAIHFLEKRGRLRLLAVCNPPGKNADQASVWLPKVLGRSVPRYDDLAAFWESGGKASIVAIATPSGSHYELAKQALETGSHLILEKPMCLHAYEAAKLRECAAAQGLRIAMAHVYRFLPLMRELATDLAAGRFGRPLYASCNLRWGHDQAYYDQASWRGTREGDGGVLMNQAIHALDLAFWLLGDATCLAAQGMRAKQNHQMEMEDLALVTLQFANDAYLQLEATSSSDPAEHEVQFFNLYEQAEIRLARRGKKIQASIRERGGRELCRHYLWRWLRAEIQRHGLGFWRQLSNPHLGLYSDLLEALAEGREPLANAAAGEASVQLVERLYRLTALQERPLFRKK